MAAPKRVRRAKLNHAVRRAQERYGIAMSQYQLQEIAKIIKSGEAHNIGNNQWLLKWSGTWLRVAKIHKWKLPLTFLPITPGIQKIIDEIETRASEQAETHTESEAT